jgi:DNA-directed RNA polymerase
MIKFDENKIIIEIENTSPIEYAQTMQKSLIDLISIIDYSNIQNIEQSIFGVCQLIKEFTFENDSLKSMFDTKDGRHIFIDKINQSFINSVMLDEAQFRDLTETALIKDSQINEIKEVVKEIKTHQLKTA